MSRLSLAACLAVLAACGGDAGAGPGTPPPPPPPPGGQPGLTATVTMGTTGDGYGGTQPAFVPAQVTIARGGTVTFSNTLGGNHTVTFAAVAGAPANIPAPAAGETPRLFPVAGTFPFSCSVHPVMTGQVVVQ